MSKVCMIFLFADSFSFFTLLSVGVASAVFGYLLKLGIIEKYRRKVLRLEDEMLANHSRILSLEKKNAQLQSLGSKILHESKEHKNMALKVS